MEESERLGLLNGFCTDFPFAAKEELNVPYFVNEDHRYKQARQWRENVEEANVGAAIGVAKKHARQAETAERHQKEGILFMLGTMLLFLIVGAIG